LQACEGSTCLTQARASIGTGPGAGQGSSPAQPARACASLTDLRVGWKATRGKTVHDLGALKLDGEVPGRAHSGRPVRWAGAEQREAGPLRRRAQLAIASRERQAEPHGRLFEQREGGARGRRDPAAALARDQAKRF
jgi:hypothetical protein